MTSSSCVLALDQVVVLLRQERMALLGLLVFLDGDEIHRADFVEPFLQRLDLLATAFQSVAAPAAAICSGVSVSTLAGPSSA